VFILSRKAGCIPEETKTQLLKSAAEEFSAYGFQKSSLRRICAKANVTTGALYFFFQDKEDLFSQVISPAIDRIYKIIETHYEKEVSSPDESVIRGEDEDFRACSEILSFYYQNKMICDIILNHQDHPAIAAFFNHVIELMDDQTIQLLKFTGIAMHSTQTFSDYTIHWFSHLQMDSILNIIFHCSNEEQAKENLKTMIRFLRGGFFALLPDEFISNLK